MAEDKEGYTSEEYQTLKDQGVQEPEKRNNLKKGLLALAGLVGLAVGVKVATDPKLRDKIAETAHNTLDTVGKAEAELLDKADIIEQEISREPAQQLKQRSSETTIK